MDKQTRKNALLPRREALKIWVKYGIPLLRKRDELVQVLILVQVLYKQLYGERVSKTLIKEPRLPFQNFDRQLEDMYCSSETLYAELSIFSKYSWNFIPTDSSTGLTTSPAFLDSQNRRLDVSTIQIRVRAVKSMFSFLFTHNVSSMEVELMEDLRLSHAIKNEYRGYQDNELVVHNATEIMENNAGFRFKTGAVLLSSSVSTGVHVNPRVLEFEFIKRANDIVETGRVYYLSITILGMESLAMAYNVDKIKNELKNLSDTSMVFQIEGIRKLIESYEPWSVEKKNYQGHSMYNIDDNRELNSLL
jgi:hypothetical protein